MSQLAVLQNSMLQTLFNPSRDGMANVTDFVAYKSKNTLSNRQKYPTKHQDRGMQVYRANAQVAATRNLSVAYPVTAQLVGEEAFTLLARDMWHRFPPVRGDAAQWGADLAQLISSIAELDPEPYLPDVARIEWVLHQAASALDAELDLSSLALLSTHDPDAITLQMAPGTHVVNSPYPAASIILAHTHDILLFDELQIKLRTSNPESALIWRQGFRPCVAVCTAADAIFIQNVLDGASLAAALDATETLDDTGKFDFNSWLTRSAQSGLLIGTKFLANH